MNKFLVLGLASTLLVGGIASAQTASNDVRASAVFFDGDPFDGGAEVTTATLSASPIAKAIEDLEDATYLTLSVGESNGTFEIAQGGNNKYDIQVELESANGIEVITLAEVMKTLERAVDGDMNLAVFTDGTPGEGIIKGYYAFYDGVDPNVFVGDSSHVSFLVGGETANFELASNGVSKLSAVQVMRSGKSVSLFQLGLEAARN